MGTLRRWGGSATSLALGAAFLLGCNGKQAGVALAKAEANDEIYAHLPPPPADGPKLAALRKVVIHDRPTVAGQPIGMLALGSVVARSREPATRSGCDGGWYVVRPRGFVCADGSVVLDERAAKIAPTAANLERALPFRYARAKAENVPLYARLPTVAEQSANEPDLGKRGPKALDTDPIGPGANDVPLDVHLAASGPPVLLATGEGIEAGKRTTASFFSFGKEAIAPLLPFSGASAVKAGAMHKGSGLAIASAFSAEGPGAMRHFGLTPDGLVVPLDRMKPMLGTTWHGTDLEGIGLPIAFVHKQGVHTFTMRKGKASKNEDELERRAAVPMSGKFRTVEGVKYEETRQGEWLRAQDLVSIVKRTKFPDFVHGKQKWIDVSIANQTLTVYEGSKPLYATLVSTGRDQLKDPATSASTPKGAFKVRAKSVRRTLDGREAGGGAEMIDAPWALELESDNALVGATWTDGFGEVSTYHDIALAPIDAHRIWTWATPAVPDAWAAAAATPDDATYVSVRP